MNNTSQFVNNIPYDDWPLALGVGLGLAVSGILAVGVVGYWWLRAPGPLPDTVVIGMNNIEQLSCFPSVFSTLLTTNLATLVFCAYLLLFILVFFSFSRNGTNKSFSLNL